MSSIRKKIKDFRGESTKMKYLYAGFCKRLPVKKNLVLFESFHGRDISDSPLYIARALIEITDINEYEMYFATADMKKHKQQIAELELDVKLVDIHSKEYAQVLATSEYLVNNSSFPSYFVKRKGQKYLQTWHGTPLKTLGKSMKMGMESMHNVQHNFLQADMLMYPNKFTKEVMMEDYNLNELFTGRVVLCGYPRNSIFRRKDMAEEVKKTLGNEQISTIAYMPTWRGQSNYDIRTDEYAESVRIILKEMDSALSSSQKLYVNFHPLVSDIVSLEEYEHIESFPSTVDKYEFLNSTDALITDYSSVFFDYSITGKPIILFMYDYDEYMEDRGMYMDVRELPFTQISDTQELCRCIADREYEKCTYTMDSGYVERFIKYDTADNAMKMCRLFFLGEEDGMEIEDYSSNLDRKWTVLDAENVRTPQQLDYAASQVKGDSILMLAKRNFNPKMSSYMYENYLDSFNYVFTVKSVPRTYAEDIAMRLSRKVRHTVEKRNIKRCFGNLNVTEVRKTGIAPSAGKVLKIRTKGTSVRITARLSGKAVAGFNGVMLVFRSQVDTIVYPFSCRVQGNILEADLNIIGLNLDGIYWDMLVCYDDNGNEVQERLNLGRKQKLHLTLSCTQCITGNYIFFPHITLEGQMAFTHRELTPYDDARTRIKEIFAYAIYRIAGGYFRKKKPWLVFEKFCQMAQDNGYYFFRYCMEELPESEKKNIYYVMKEDAGDWKKVSGYGRNVLKFMSIRHMLYVMAAEVCVGSDSKKHLYIWRPKPNLISRRIRNKKIMFLQHGVTALKRVDGIFGVHGSSPMTHFATTSEYEQNIVVDNFGYAPEDAPVLGFARWDVLEDTSKEDDRLILVMPTWRSWLEERTKEEFKLSDYYANYMKLLSDDRLEKLLESYDARMIFYIHPKFKDYLGEFVIDSSRIKLVPFGSTPLNAIMRDCRLLITDYSSVCWDVYYLGKPVMFYQFDYDMYISTHGSYMDMTEELFGDRYFDSDSVIAGIEQNLRNDFAEDEKSAAMRQHYFKYIDNNNCRRTYEYLRGKGY